MAGTPSSSPLRPDTIEGLESNAFSALVMLAGMQLDVFTTLEDGPKTADEVAAALDRSPGAVYMLRARAHDHLRVILGSASRYLSNPS